MGDLDRRNGLGLLPPQCPQGESAHKRQRQGQVLGMQKEELSLHRRGRGKAYFFTLRTGTISRKSSRGQEKDNIAERTQDSLFKGQREINGESSMDAYTLPYVNR